MAALDLDLEELRARYLGGETCAQIAQTLACNRNSVRNRLVAAGVRMRIGPMPYTPEQRLLRLTRKTDTCWIWEGVRTRGGTGYGFLANVGGRSHVYAHRLAWELFRGPIPQDMFVLHRCDNPPCVRPDHLFLGTPKDNMDDMRRKGREIKRGAIGERNSHAKLTASQVATVRLLLRGGRSLMEIAHFFGVGVETIRAIAKGQTWRSTPESDLVLVDPAGSAGVSAVR